MKIINLFNHHNQVNLFKQNINKFYSQIAKKDNNNNNNNNNINNKLIINNLSKKKFLLKA